MNWETIICLGDSITAGSRSYLGYPEWCAHFLKKQLNKEWHLINHSTAGYTTMDLMKSLNTELINYKSLDPGIITLLIGTNDLKNDVTAVQYELAFDLLLCKIKLLALNENVVLMFIPNFTSEVFYPYKGNMNETINAYNLIIEDLSKKHNIRTLELSFTEEDLFDGVHLSDEGSKHVGEQLANFIIKDKSI